MNAAGFSELLGQLPDFLGWHMILSLAALFIGLAISIPLGIIASQKPRVAEWVLGVAGIVQTVPPLALLALMVPLLKGTIGFLPAFIALLLYSMLPILANTVAGIRGVDPALTEAATGLGMNAAQMLLRVQLPLAAPVILAGVRTATVQVIGTATLGTPVGCTSLGNYIFQGLETRNSFSTVFGCVVAALVAIAMDQLVHAFEIAARRRSRRLAGGATLATVLIVAAAAYVPLSQMAATTSDHVIVGSGPFTEQHILSDVLASRLRAAGFTVEQHKGMGETIQYEALREGSIDTYVDYSGNVWALLMKRTEVAGRRKTLDEAGQYLAQKDGILSLGSLGFENAYALAMRQKQAHDLGVHSIGDLAPYTSRLKIGGDHEFFGRPEWTRTRDTYGLHFAQQISMDPTLMYTAASGGTVDVISAYTTDGRIITENLVILDDPKQILPPYDAMLLVSPKAKQRPGFVDALRQLVGAIPMDAMREANRLVDLDHRSAPDAAHWLLAHLAPKH